MTLCKVWGELQRRWHDKGDDDDHVVLRFREAFEEYNKKLNSAAGDKKEELLQKAKDVTDKISLIQEPTTWF